MAGNGFLPNRDAALLTWAQSASSFITATPTAYGLTTAIATALASAVSTYSTALEAAQPGVRNRMAVLTKNNARAALKTNIRAWAKIVEGTATVTNAQKAQLGLNVRSLPSPIPPPATAPALDVVAVNGRTVNVRLHEAGSTRRGKPAGVSGAAVMSYVGATPPADMAGWKLEGLASRTTFQVSFALTLAPGATVWLAAYWFNERKQAGPVCTPIAVTFGAATSALAA
jgi:hypothetical protein